ncbi:hypothetical protein BS78_09G102300 [Paspalum vaginatum]|nr:hypothetical protein BS78_09G102300 [Paspalum vaginatum]
MSSAPLHRSLLRLANPLPAHQPPAHDSCGRRPERRKTDPNPPSRISLISLPLIWQLPLKLNVVYGRRPVLQYLGASSVTPNLCTTLRLCRRKDPNLLRVAFSLREQHTCHPQL